MFPLAGFGQTRAPASVVVAGPTLLTGGLLPATLEAFAGAKGLGLKREYRGTENVDLTLTSPAAPAGVLTLKIRRLDSTRAREAVASGAAAVALVRGPVPDGAGMVLGNDAVVPVVAPHNPLAAIAPARLAEVLTGKITSWKDLGGADRPIHVYLIEPQTDQARLTDYYFLHGAPPAVDTRIQISEQALTDAVAGDPDGIGVASFSDLGNARAVPLAGGCAITVAATRLAIRNQDYPLSFAISLVTGPGKMPALLAEYLAFLRSPAAGAAIRQAGLVDPVPESEPLAAQGKRLVNAIKLSGDEVPAADLQRLAQTLDGQARLSVTFRFEPGSSALDAGSKARVARLAGELKAGKFDGRGLTFVGFSDGVGAPDQNLKIGLARAKAVEAAVREAAGELGGHPVELGADSFGETLPIACDDTEWGRFVNRRVEVWVK